MPLRVPALRPYVAKRQHPFRALPGTPRLGLAAVLGIIALIVHRRQAVHAKTPRAPHGMLSFTLAGNPRTAQRVRSSWPRATRQAADANLRLDILFSLTWSNAIALADLWAADQLAHRRWPAATLGDALAWGQWGAAVLAAAKDIDKLTTLHGRTARPWERGARWAAIAEIAAKGAGTGYAAAGGGAWLLARQGSLGRGQPQ